ncbi:NADH dehydrogenase [ubiquinone] iron-sulfur protein 5 [Latimeria chalumnae]|uniref:NADH dehydrogenase [ubiquinone] iron-sulfur protein 5 n=1 Tax=Latimeria chalumnae TaxID=7897 RepID=H3B310_LATCH|nr:PREDICTED: NADH dehydrogenase [ubiquinone] iron-sulfur protein 5 [Latimeria chalumnae]XP_005995636.1 PREDICTED: NADH dehydrogenase [ubiquinone] iron-sulfur protein 5 [Latimeria chalumnae]|eukprot:XP_005995635.1 PREDICTED: NADH dehydrogenase [ubiquinone] iron-sulfur protein 5 [Latimeria chalumnae]
MPFINLQDRLGINIDKWLLLQSGEQPYKRAARCHAFEKEWVECSDGIGQIRARRECKLEFEDFYECMHRFKTYKRMYEIKKQKEKLIKEGNYKPPDYHTGEGESRP